MAANEAIVLAAPSPENHVAFLSAPTLSHYLVLGAILFALLTGRAPFGETNVLDTLERVRERLPDPPRKLNPRVPRDLEVICDV